ncbi:MAG: family peptidase [Modestobacter sp.]|nr:family peptidase [Modestobacter sp.]
MHVATARPTGRGHLPVTLLAILSMIAAVGLGAAGAASAAAPVAYPGSVPPWATAANDAGTTPSDETIEGEMYLSLRDLPGATALATAVSTPGTAQYRHWVGPQQWIDRFSPTPRQYQGVLAELRAKGLIITGSPKSRLFVVFRGTAAQLGAAFGTSMHLYSVDHRRLAAPATPPSLPADLASSVAGLILDQGRQLTRPDSAVTRDAGTAAGPAAGPAATTRTTPAQTTASCSAYYGEHTATMPAAYGQTSFPTSLCGYVPAQLRSAYGVPGRGSPVLAAAGRPTEGLTGAGQTVAIIDAYASPTIVQDVDTYSQRHGEPPLTTYSQRTPPVSYDLTACGLPSGWQGEQTLDVEAVHGMAPAAKILYVGAFNCAGGVDVALSTILDDRLSTIVSNSYSTAGEALAADAVRNTVNQHLQAAAEGIGLYYSSGDSGDEAAVLGSPSANLPSSSPWATAVGGTSTGIGPDGAIVLETGWGSNLDQVQVGPSGTSGYAQPLPGTFSNGAGGGRSTLFAQPDYQRGVVPAGLAQGKRVSPDIAADADAYTGELVGLRPIIDDTTLATGPYKEASYGGTSLAAPLVAAQMALVQQLTSSTIGFANPTLYGLHRSAPATFRDVVPRATPFALAHTSPLTGTTTLVTGDKDTSLTVARGYDDVTGLGAISFDILRRSAAG